MDTNSVQKAINTIETFLQRDSVQKAAWTSAVLSTITLLGSVSLIVLAHGSSLFSSLASRIAVVAAGVGSQACLTISLFVAVFGLRRKNEKNEMAKFDLSAIERGKELRIEEKLKEIGDYWTEWLPEEESKVVVFYRDDEGVKTKIIPREESDAFLLESDFLVTDKSLEDEPMW